MNKDQILEFAVLHEWRYTNNTLLKSFKFDNFEAALHWIEIVVAPITKELSQYPNIVWENNKVTVIVYTKDAQDITIKDFNFIKRLEDETVNMQNSQKYR